MQILPNNYFKYSIIIPTASNTDGLIKCINSLYRTTDLHNLSLEIIIVANGSSHATHQFLEKQNDPFRILKYSESLGFVRAVNAGISVSYGQYIVLLNDDAELVNWGRQNDWLEILESGFIKHVNLNVGISGPLRFWRNNIPYVAFFCAMIKRKVFGKIGLLSEEFHPGVGDDTDFCLRAFRAGFNTVCVPDNHHDCLNPCPYPMVHDGGQTFSGLKDDAEIRDQNERLLTIKWGQGSLHAPNQI